ncbi:MAG: tRNA pseudouridine(38-40) synthase TruA [Saprospiraceae bacterium]|nr:tRNA pseudouridine(38-40) synthase TruA [Saprospiraceae bacterium]
MRYFVELAYNGTRFFGWQRQPQQLSVQEALEEAFSTILNTPISVTGCGRTDTGVHAKQYFMHFDFDGSFPKAFDRRINKYIGPDIALYSFWQVATDAHARFDATHRGYEYHLNFQKQPFEQETAYFFPFSAKLDVKAMQEAGKLLLSYGEFYPFCKSDTDVKTMKCELRQAEWRWHEEEKKLVFHIAANRFLRGMVRLIVGMCLNVGLGKLSVDEVKVAMDDQTRIQKSLSVPPQGLFLTDIRYPFLAQANPIQF